jgi:RNA polymerase sigma factor (sigma-70 family)
MSAALLSRAPTRDRAFERLYRRHVHEVYRYVLAVLRNQADAEDATQATFLSAFRAFSRGEEPLKPRNWLLKIAHNECRQRFRASARRPREVEWDERTPAPPPDETVPTAGELRTALANLSFNQRSALVMRELEGRSYAEIGEILELSVSAVETVLFRARRALREQLEGALTCGEAEATLSRRMDGRLALPEQRALRAHLRGCPECAALERKQRARRAAVKRLGAIQLPPSLAGFLGGTGSVTGGAIAGSGLAAKAAAVVAAGVVAGGVGHEAVQAVAAREPAKTPLPELQRFPRVVPDSSSGTSATPATRAGAVGVVTVFSVNQRTATTRVRDGVHSTLARRRASGDSAAESAPSADAPASAQAPAPAQASAPPGSPGAVQPPVQPPIQPPAAPQPVQEVVDTAKSVVPNVPLPTPPQVSLPPPPPIPPLPQLPPLPQVPPVPPLPPPPPLPIIGG